MPTTTSDDRGRITSKTETTRDLDGLCDHLSRINGAARLDILETTINRRVQALEVVAVPAERTYGNVVSYLVDLLSFVLIRVPLFSFAGPSDNTDSRLFP